MIHNIADNRQAGKNFREKPDEKKLPENFSGFFQNKSGRKKHGP
ncbi:MAG: hypothetical protein ACYDEZ_04975 [Methanoregula sp.]|jgi:hypothetical protein